MINMNDYILGKFSRTGVHLLLFLFVLVVSGCDSETSGVNKVMFPDRFENPKKKRNEEDYNHRYSGIILPEHVPGMELLETLKYDRQGFHLSRKFHYPVTNGRILYTVYVYPLSRKIIDQKGDKASPLMKGNSFEKQFKQEQRNLSKAHPNWEKDSISSSPLHSNLTGKQVTFSFKKNIKEAQVPMRSGVYLHMLPTGWLLKYRITYPVPLKEKAIDGLFRLANQVTIPS